MTVVQIEKAVTAKLKERLLGLGFEYSKASHRYLEHYVEFLSSSGEIDYRLSMHYLKYGKVQLYLSGKNTRVGNLYDNINKGRSEQSLRLLSVSLRNFLHPTNSDEFFHTGLEIDPPSQDELMWGRDLDIATDAIYELIERSVPKIVQETNSLEKLDRLYNEPVLKSKIGDKPPMRIHSASLPDQVLVSLLIAQLINPSKLQELAARYRPFADEFESGEDDTIDIMLELIQRIENEQNSTQDSFRG